MRQVTLTVLALVLISSTAQAATTERRHPRTNHPTTVERAAAWEKWRNSNAYVVPDSTSELSEGAMTSGIAGH